MKNAYHAVAQQISETCISHPIWTDVLDHSQAQICFSNPSEMVGILGPSRVGKSKMSLAIRESFLNSSGGRANESRDYLCLRASNSGVNGSFSSKAFALQGLTQLESPFYSFDKQRSGKKPDWDYSASSALLWESLTRAIHLFGIKYVFIDEAQNIVYAPGSNGAGAVMDAMKCLAEEANVVIVMTGTYQVHSIMQAAPHVIGRKTLVHFPRYKPDRQGVNSFSDILGAYGELLDPVSDIGYLDDHTEFFYKGSLGCIGHLERWLRSAMALAMAENQGLNLGHFESRRLPKSEREILHDEYSKGEQLIESLSSGNHMDGLDVLEGGTKDEPDRAPRLNGSPPFANLPVRHRQGGRAARTPDV